MKISPILFNFTINCGENVQLLSYEKISNLLNCNRCFYELFADVRDPVQRTGYTQTNELMNLKI